MSRILKTCATVLMAAVCLPGLVSVMAFAQQTQAQQPTTDQQKKKTTGASKSTNKNAPAKADDADKLTPDRMSTRGLHRTPKTQPDDKSTKPDQQSTTKSAPDK